MGSMTDREFLCYLFGFLQKYQSWDKGEMILTMIEPDLESIIQSIRSQILKGKGAENE
jgi:hypothetical protein